MILKKLLSISIGTLMITPCFSQEIGLSTNLLYGGVTTPNLSVEAALGRKTTLEFTGAYNPFTFSDHKKFRHWKVQPELRLWNCEKFIGSFWGVHAFYTFFNAGGIDLPGNLLSGLKDHRYQGYATGAGISYGYQWYLGPHWNLEALIGVGYAYLNYDKYECHKCGKHLEKSHKNYVEPTRAAISLVYLFQSKK